MCEKIGKAITVYVNGNQCNLRCSYCYVTRANKGVKKEEVKIQYPIEIMVGAFSPKRLGGICDITVIGSAETLLERDVIPFIHGLLHQGHIVTVVTNATLSDRIEQLLDTDKEDIKNLIVKASLHWNELKKRNLIERYFINIKKVIEMGGSSYPFLVISDEYIPFLEDIVKTCKDYLGVPPHCSPCLDIINDKSIKYKADFRPRCTNEMVEKIDKMFDSKIYDEIVKNKECNPQEQFCYAGVWSFGVDFSTGAMYKCHSVPLKGMNFYENIEKELKLDSPVACSCGIESCCLQYNFFAEGLMPDYKSNVLYGDMIYKKGLITEEVREKLNIRFDEIYSRFSTETEKKFILENKNEQIEQLVSVMKANPFFQEEIYDKIQEGRKIVIYGTGKNYMRYKHTIGFPVTFFLDSYVTEELIVDGIKCVRPETISNDKYKELFIVISTQDKNSIQQKLEGMGLIQGEDYI